MKNFAGIAGTKFGSEAVMKSEAAFQNFETPPLRSETPPLCAKIPVPGMSKKAGISK